MNFLLLIRKYYHLSLYVILVIFIFFLYCKDLAQGNTILKENIKNTECQNEIILQNTAIEEWRLKNAAAEKRQKEAQKEAEKRSTLIDKKMKDIMSEHVSTDCNKANAYAIEQALRRR